MSAPLVAFPEAEYTRLIRVLNNARDHFYRRAETVEITGGFCQRWTVDCALLVPLLEYEQEGCDVRTCVSIGLFSKERMADLSMRSPTAHASLLSNRNICTILAFAFTTHAQSRITSAVESRYKSEAERSAYETALNDLGILLRAGAFQILLAQPQPALQVFEDIRKTVEDLATALSDSIADTIFAAVFETLNKDEVVWEQLRPLCSVLHVLAEVNVEAGSIYEFTLEYTDVGELAFQSIKSADRSSAVDPTASGKGGALNRIRDLETWAYSDRKWRQKAVRPLFWLSQQFVALMSLLGLVGTPVRLVRQNADHCNSYYLMLDLPDDVMCSRLYWRQLESIGIDRSNPPVATAKPVLASAWFGTRERLGASECMVELQAARSSRLQLSLVIAAVGTFASAFILRNNPLGTSEGQRQVAIGIAAILLLAPGSALGVLTATGSRLELQLTRGIRALLGISALSLVATAFLLAVLDNRSQRLFTTTATISSVISCVATVLLFGVAYGPRWPDRPSRLKRIDARAKVRSEIAPANRRFRQRLAGLVWLFLTMAATEFWWRLITDPVQERLRSREGAIEAIAAARDTTWLVWPVRPLATWNPPWTIAEIALALLAIVALVVLRARRKA